MPTSVKAMTLSTCVTLVVVSAYSVALGGSGLVWFFWVVLLAATVGVAVTSGR